MDTKLNPAPKLRKNSNEPKAESAEVNSKPTAKKVPRIEITAEALLRAPIPKMPALVDPFFPKVGVVALGGSSDTGKSCFLNQFAMAVVSGEKDFLGFPIEAAHRNVIYVTTEDDLTAIAFRLEKQNVKPYNPIDLQGLRYWFDSENLLDIIEAALTEQPADCVIIDAFSDIFGDSDMNQVSKVRSLLNNYRSLAQRKNCLFIFLHHTGKRTDDGVPSKHDLLGSQGFEAKMRSVLMLRKDKYDESVRNLVIVKGNYISPDIKKKAFALKFEDLVFTNTGIRLERDKLAVSEVKPWHTEAIRLHKDGKSYRAISIELKHNGFVSCSKSSVENFLNSQRINTIKIEEPQKNDEKKSLTNDQEQEIKIDRKVINFDYNNFNEQGIDESDIDPKTKIKYK